MENLQTENCQPAGFHYPHIPGSSAADSYPGEIFLEEKPLENIKKKKTRKKIAVDLFCGAGGTSTGLIQMCEEEGIELELVAINHDLKAIDSHAKNHTTVRHLCQSIETINPHDVVTGGRLDILLASPSCIHHSRARAGRPKSDQQRADPWLLLRWIDHLYIDTIVLENVEEIMTWGPLTAKGYPDKRRKGEYFAKFIAMLEVNYSVEYRVLNCADYGDASSRKRFFMIAKRGKKQVVFPEPTHISRKELEKLHARNPLFAGSLNETKRKVWRSAGEIIEWELDGESIFNRRKKPLSPNTIRRIFAGFFKYSISPFIIGAGGTTGQQNPRDINEPMNTILTKNSQGVVSPYIINMKGANINQSRSIDDPTFTQTTKDHQFLVNPKVYQFGNGFQAGADKNIPSPYIVTCNHGKGDLRAYPIDDPMRTVTSSDAWACIEPVLFNYKNRPHEKCSKLNGQHSAVEHGNEILDIAVSVAAQIAGGQRKSKLNNSADSEIKWYENLSREELQLVNIGSQTEPYYVLNFVRFNFLIDIKFRMLGYSELARCMSFPEGYQFVGSRKDKVKMIGNAVPCKTAKALCRAAMLGKATRFAPALWN